MDQAFAGLSFGARAQQTIFKHGEEVRVFLEIHNTSDKPTQLTLLDIQNTSGQLFHVDIYFIMNWLPNEHPVWSTPLRFPGDSQTIPAKSIYKNEFLWRQVDTNGQPVGPGIYEARVRCTTREFSSLAKAQFTIQ